MTREFIGRGWKFPVTADADGLIGMSAYEEDIREAILIILSTAKGERVMHPDFGCGIHDYVYEAVNTTTVGLIESSVRDALTKWEPRIDPTGVTVTTDHIAEGKLDISIDYTVRSTNNRFNLVYPFYLTERT